MQAWSILWIYVFYFEFLGVEQGFLIFRSNLKMIFEKRGWHFRRNYYVNILCNELLHCTVNCYLPKLYIIIMSRLRHDDYIAYYSQLF